MKTVLLILVVAVLLPFVVFASVKLGTYAFYRGRAAYLDERRRNGHA